MGVPVSDPTRSTAALSEDDAVLRAKYLDYCSARVAELFLSLPPDEIFVLADQTGEQRPGAAEATYDALVRGAALKLAERLGLPSFDEWSEAYEADPGLFEPELMGLWKSDALPRGKPGDSHSSDAEARASEGP